jgi:hypothetical protein
MRVQLHKLTMIVVTTLVFSGTVAAQPQSKPQPPGMPRRPNYPNEAKGTACPRADLKALVDAYSAAMAAHDPGKVAFAKGIRFTENTEVFDPGKSALWKGAGAWALRNDLIDTERCGTVSWGVIEEDNHLIHVAIRLQTDKDGKISEAEHITAKEGGFFFNPKAILATSYLDWETILAPNERSSREAMTAAANDYFFMFDITHYVSVPFADRCERWENGLNTTRTHDCKPTAASLKTENSHPPRRIPLVDLEAGIVAAFVNFRHKNVDVHIMKMQRGRVAYMMAVVGPETESDGWLVNQKK